MLSALKREGVSIGQYFLGSQPNKGDLEYNMNRILESVYSRGIVIDLDSIFGMLTTQTLPPQTITELVKQVSAGASSSAMGTSTALSQQGTAQPQTTQTTQEVQKK